MSSAFVCCSLQVFRCLLLLHVNPLGLVATSRLRMAPKWKYRRWKKKVFKKHAICTSGLIGSEHPSVGSFPCAARICGVFKAGGKCLFKKAGKGKCMCVCLCDAIVCTLQFSINAFFILQKLEGIDVTVGTTESDELWYEEICVIKGRPALHAEQSGDRLRVMKDLYLAVITGAPPIFKVLNDYQAVKINGLF